MLQISIVDDESIFREKHHKIITFGDSYRREIYEYLDGSVK